MSNETYLLRAAGIACLLLGSIATVVAVAQRPSPSEQPVVQTPSDDGAAVASKNGQ